jgi:hypothetical protein
MELELAKLRNKVIKENKKLGTIPHTYNLSTWEPEAGPCLKTKWKQKQKREKNLVDKKKIWFFPWKAKYLAALLDSLIHILAKVFEEKGKKKFRKIKLVLKKRKSGCH